VPGQKDQDSPDMAPTELAPTELNPDGVASVERVVVESVELRPGDILRERYVIERLLGEGGMGQVFLAVDREAEASNPHVALKMLGEAFKAHPQSLKALRREASQSQRMNHPNIVNVFYFERTVEHVFMVMEFMQGSSLDEVLDKNPEGMNFKSVWQIVEGCAEGLKYIHNQRVIHSDFKPSNVFLTHDGEVKVLDLGIARSLDEVNAEEGTTRFDPDALGALTPSYASCEMFEGLTPTEQDDLYALACVTYELLTGYHPYQRKNAMEARAEQLEPVRPKGLRNRQWRALKSALAFSRGNRPATVGEFLTEFNPEAGKQNKAPWVAAAATAAVIAVAVTAFAVFRLDDPDQKFQQATLARFPPGPDLVDTQRAQSWLDQGEFFLQLGKDSLMSTEYDRGISQLLLAPSSAYQSYRLVLSKSDDASLRDNAVSGLLAIAVAFREVAIALSENEAAAPEDVAKNVCSSLEVYAQDSAMLELLAQLDDQMPNRVISVRECRRLVESGKVSV